jgi:hypothetical protein
VLDLCLGFCSAPAGLAEPPFWTSCHGEATRGGSGSKVKMEAISVVFIS